MLNKLGVIASSLVDIVAFPGFRGKCVQRYSLNFHSTLIINYLA